MKKNINKYETNNEYTTLIIIDNKNRITKVLVDNDDVDTLKHYSFRVNSNGYIKTQNNIYLHRLIKDVPSGYEIDHINRNKLDNRKNNLRITNHKDNCNNRYKDVLTGINKLKRLKTKPYQLRINGKHIGYYSTLEEAILEKQLYMGT